MRRIWNRLYWGLAIIGMLVPLQVKAAQQDTVTLRQEGYEVAVSLGMSNAKEEKITAVSVALKVDTGGADQAVVEFAFDAGLEGVTEHDFIYDAGTGRMDIYVTSMKNQSLFGEGELKLGHVQVWPVDSSRTLQVEVGYLENSFQTANLSYGDKTPIVSPLPEPVHLQVGAGAVYQPPEQADAGQTNKNRGNDKDSQKSDSENDNINRGLYDEETRFVNNPADAQKIFSPVIKENDSLPAMTDMSQGLAAAIGGGKTLTGAFGAGQARGAKVSVVAPEDGPDSILIAKGDGSFAQTGEGEGGFLASAQNGSGEGGAFSDEIKLDKKNGGAVDDKKGKKLGRWIFAGVAAGFLVILGIVLFIFLSRKEEAKGTKKAKSAVKKKKKPVRRKKRKQAGPERGKKRKPVPVKKQAAGRKK